MPGNYTGPRRGCTLAEDIRTGNLMASHECMSPNEAAMSRRRISRRNFVAGAGRLALGATIVPRHVLGRGYQAPSDTLNVAIVGAGGMGISNAEQLVTQNIVALCDVDFGYVERSLAGRGKDGQGNPRPNGIKLQEAMGKAARYADFREMLEQFGQHP